MFAGYTHAQVLRTIRECPDPMQLKLHRSVDGNVYLLQQQQANDNIMKRKVRWSFIFRSKAHFKHVILSDNNRTHLMYQL